MTSMITKEVLPVDVGEVAAADLEAVVCEVDLVVAEAASEEETEADEAVVGVVAEAEEVTLMVKAARKLKKHDENKISCLKRPPSRYEKNILYLKKTIKMA